MRNNVRNFFLFFNLGVFSVWPMGKARTLDCLGKSPRVSESLRRKLKKKTTKNSYLLLEIH